MPTAATTRSFFGRLHDLFFALSFLCPVHLTYHATLWLVEKLILLGPLLLPVFDHTPWDYLNEFIMGFNLLHYFTSYGTGFMICALALFIAFHCFLAVLVYRLVRAKGSYANWVLALGFPLVHSILVQITALVAFYLFAILLRGESATFPNARDICATLVNYLSPPHIVLCALYGLMLVEVVALDAIYILLFQDDRLTIRCTRSWKFKMLDLASRLTILAVFVFDTEDDYSLWSTAVLGLMFLGKLVGWIWISADRRDLPEYAYDLLALLFIAFNGITTQLSLSNYYQYGLILPVYTAMACALRMLIHSRETPAELRTEGEVLDYLRTVAKLFVTTHTVGMLKAFELLERHRMGCTRGDCDCREVTMSNFTVGLDEVTKLNETTYETGRDMPDWLAKSYKRKVLAIYLSDVRPALTKTPNVGLVLAEMYYYFMANHYQALMYVQAVEQMTRSLIIRQHTANLRHVIEEGMSKDTEESLNLLAALRFQTEYYSFLMCIEYSCECTTKFWRFLADDQPDPVVLSHLGQEIYETSQKLFRLVKSINRASPDHIQFLFKFGLYAKRILHDKESSTYAFQRLTWNTENAALISRKDQLMTLVVSLEQRNFCDILDLNIELERRLGFRRDELLGFPATKLMHSRIAKQHQTMAERYFRTMKSEYFGCERQQFLRHKDGYILTCKATKKLMPNLDAGLRGAMLIYPDSAASSYTAQRLDHTRRRASVMLCDDRGKVAEYTKDVKELGLHKELLISGLTLQNVFPELRDERVFQFASRPQGTVLLFSPANGNEETCQDEPGERSLGESSQAAANNVSTLMWIRVVREKCGDEDQIVAAFSPILKQVAREYRPVAEFSGRLFQRVDQVTRLAARGLTPSNRIQPTSEATSPEGGNSYVNFEAGNDTESQASAESAEESVSSVRTQSADGQDALLRGESQQTDAAEIPGIIKKLRAILGVFLVTVIVLIAVETTEFSNEVGNLTGRFEMIEYFTIRYELLLYMVACPMNYDLYRRANDAAVFVSYCVRARARADRASNFNVLLKKSFTKFGMEYDYDKITIYAGSGSYPVAVDYAILNYINRIMMYTSLNDFYTSKYCINNYTDTTCEEVNLALDYCMANGIPTLKPQQTKLSKVLIDDLLNFALSGRDSLYILISLCIAAVVLSSVLILVFLIWVIKGKSRVMSIFAEITPEEVQIILTQAKSIKIVDAQFDPKYVTLCEGNEEKFWRFFCRRPHRHNALQGAPQGESQADGKLAPNNGDSHQEENRGEESGEDSEEKDKQAGKEAEKQRLEKEKKQRQETKRMLLGQIDSRLRNRAMLKLGGVLAFFLMYGVGSLYFNYYVHDFNGTTTNFFYVLTKRDTYATILSTFLRMSVMKTDKSYIQYSDDPNDMMMMDYVDESLRVEVLVRDYNTKEVNSYIFSGYLDLSSKLDSELFCDYVDSYNVGQTGNCNTSYGGPKNLGLTVGMSYYIDYHITYSSKIMAANFSDSATVSAMAADPALSFPGAKVMIYLQSALEQQLIQYRKDALSFYGVISAILIAKGTCFAVLFFILYIVVFSGVLNTLTREISLTKGMVSMIPRFVIEGNLRVQKLVYKCRRAEMS